MTLLQNDLAPMPMTPLLSVPLSRAFPSPCPNANSPGRAVTVTDTCREGDASLCGRGLGIRASSETLKGRQLAPNKSHVNPTELWGFLSPFTPSSHLTLAVLLGSWRQEPVSLLRVQCGLKTLHFAD